MQELFGDIGPNVEKVSDTEYKVLPPADANLDPSTWKWTSSLADNGAALDPRGRRRSSCRPTSPRPSSRRRAARSPPSTHVDVDADVLARTVHQDVVRGPQHHLAQQHRDLRCRHAQVRRVDHLRWRRGAVGRLRRQLEDLGVTQNVELHQKYYDDYIASK